MFPWGLDSREGLCIRDSDFMTPHWSWYRVLGFLGSASGKGPACQCRRHKRYWFDPWIRKIPWRRHGNPLLLFLPGESHGRRSLAGYKSMGSQRVRHDWVTEHAHTHVWTAPTGGCKLVWMPTVLSGGNTVKSRVICKLASDVLLEWTIFLPKPFPLFCPSGFCQKYHHSP